LVRLKVGLYRTRPRTRSK